MTEQEQVSAIMDLGKACCWRIMRKQWGDESQQDQESLIHATVAALHALNETNNLNAKDVCEFLVVPHYDQATAEQKTICENAVQAMREVLESEIAQSEH